MLWRRRQDRKSTRLNSSHANISYAVFCLKKKKRAALGPIRDPSSAPRLLEHRRPGRRNRADAELPQLRQPRLAARHQGLAPAFFFKDTATTEIYTLSLHDALPI